MQPSGLIEAKRRLSLVVHAATAEHMSAMTNSGIRRQDVKRVQPHGPRSSAAAAGATQIPGNKPRPAIGTLSQGGADPGGEGQDRQQAGLGGVAFHSLRLHPIRSPRCAVIDDAGGSEI